MVEPFERRVREGVARGLVTLKFRHRVDRLTSNGGALAGVAGTVLEPSSVSRGQPSSRTPVGEFELGAQAVIVTSGGIGANHELVRAAWPSTLGTPAATHALGRPRPCRRPDAQDQPDAGATIINPDRMWHYTEGIENWNPIWTRHGIRILPGPSPLWLDATGRRLPVPLFPGFDTLGTLEHLMTTGHDYSWFVLTQKIIEREFALSGSEQNPDLTVEEHAPGAREPGRQGRAAAGRGVQAPRRRLHRRARSARAGPPHERADRR